MIIGSSSQTGRISNPGFFEMSGALTVGSIHEHLGRFILAGNSTLNFGNSPSQLAFADSSHETWQVGGVLSVLNWNGSTNGGGAEQLIFRNNANGLTPGQLSQIQFVNAAGFGSGTNFAKILASGEVVPTVQPSLLIMRTGNSVILSWPNGFFLQSATNVQGPYVDVIGATSPFVINSILDSKRFCRLRP